MEPVKSEPDATGPFKNSLNEMLEDNKSKINNLLPSFPVRGASQGQTQSSEHPVVHNQNVSSIKPDPEDKPWTNANCSGGASTETAVKEEPGTVKVKTESIKEEPKVCYQRFCSSNSPRNQSAIDDTELNHREAICTYFCQVVLETFATQSRRIVAR